MSPATSVYDGSRASFAVLKDKGLEVCDPERTFATPDHYVSTLGNELTAITEP